MGVFFLFLLALAAGCLSTLFWIPEDDLGRGYFQLNALILLALLALAVALFLLHPFEPFAGPRGAVTLFGGFAACFGYYAGVWRQLWRVARGFAALALATTVAALLGAGHQLLPAAAAPLPYRGTLLAGALLSSALLLGWSLTTMLLGHWYLVAPRLSFRHLTVFCAALTGLVVVRTATAAAGMTAAALADPALEPHPWTLLAGLAGEGIFLWFRLLWGLAIPLALGLMALHCARQRSNQSATGILYVLVVGSFIGEITALYLTLSTGVPV
ncbi:MAG: hypothetical protein R3325_10815 [Thermoanaerobaculia bacterium]|nr:hypothetical protein [Thermoanaerobaculia bacterium]